MEDKKIYWFLTVFRVFKIEGYLDGSCTALPHGMRTWGFYTNKEDAYYVLRTNMTDLWETIYDYAVLEPYMEGISGYDFETPREWFKYNQDINSYEPIEEPRGVEHYAGFAIG